MLCLPVSAETLSDMRRAELTHLVRQDCGSCHGMTLKGGLGKPLLPGELAALDATQIRDVILEGMPGTPMPPWKSLLSQDEAQWIAEQLKTGFPP
jgi:cytochrome c55X